jgi:glycine/D-amino acid oxidase-like deaminating enzyme
MSAGDRPSAIVVGAGIFGASLADALSSRDWRVTLVERYAPGNARSSSGDVSRLLRQAYGRDGSKEEWYARLAGEARSRWKLISTEERCELFIKTGALWLAHQADGFEARSEAVLRKVGAPYERLEPSAVRDVLPELRTDDLLFVLHEPLAGVLRAAEACRVLVRRAARRGTTLICGTAAPDHDAMRVNGQTLAADRIIWACGAWLRTLFQDWAPIEATRQEVFYWDAPPHWRERPVWVDEEHETYGLPDIDGAGLKILSSAPGPPFDPDASSREPDFTAAAQIQAYAADRFPGLGELRLLRAAVMHSELTPSEDFLIGPISPSRATWLMGGGSGHGFKHGPALAAYLADVLEGRAELAEHLLPKRVV